MSVVAMSGFMNRYNDSLATVTDAESSDWAAVNLADVGWDIGKHVGEGREQRSGLPEGPRPSGHRTLQRLAGNRSIRAIVSVGFSICTQWPAPSTISRCL